MSKPSIMVCVPAYGQSVAAHTMESLFTLAQYLTVAGIRNQLSWYSAADIVEVRNLFLTSWYDCHKQFSHMLFIDADMGFQPQLIRDMVKFDKPLVGAFYARRQMPPSIVGAALDPEHTLADVTRDGFLKANYIGGGVMLISRKMIDTLIEKMPGVVDALPGVLAAATPLPLTRLIRAFDCILMDDRRLSEDVSFCSRWRDVGGEIWANVNHKISHVGPFDFHMRYMGVLEHKAAQEKQAEAA